MPTPKQSSSILLSLLFGIDAPHPKGRVIKFDENLPDIKLSTGSLQERIISALERSVHPLTSKEISEKIGCAPARVYGKLRHLVQLNVLSEVKLDGCVTEYILNNDPYLVVK